MLKQPSALRPATSCLHSACSATIHLDGWLLHPRNPQVRRCCTARKTTLLEMSAPLDELVEGGQDHDGDLIVAIAQIDAQAAAKSNQCMSLMPPFFCLPPILPFNLCCCCYFCSLSELRGTKAWLTPKFLKIEKDWLCTKSSTRIPLEKIQNVDLRSGCVGILF